MKHRHVVPGSVRFVFSPPSPGLVAAVMKNEAEKEETLQKQVLDFLAHDPWSWCWRQHIGGRRGARMGRVGQADITGMVYWGIRVEIELKKKGKSDYAPLQRAFGKRVLEMGGIYMYVDDFDDFKRRWSVVHQRKRPAPWPGE